MLEKEYPRKIDSTGRFTIPKPYLQLMGVRPNSQVNISLRSDGILMIMKPSQFHEADELASLQKENATLKERLAKILEKENHDLNFQQNVNI